MLPLLGVRVPFLVEKLDPKCHAVWPKHIHTHPKKTQKSNKKQNTIWPVSETYTNDNQQLKKKKSEMKNERKSHKK